MLQSVSILIKGRVQGVGFRYFVRKLAEKYNIKGYVMNLPEGSVYIEAEGEELSVNDFIAACRTGPSYAAINEITVNQIPFSAYQWFEVRF
jgi:acylphosphatase